MNKILILVMLIVPNLIWADFTPDAFATIAHRKIKGYLIHDITKTKDNFLVIQTLGKGLGCETARRFIEKKCIEFIYQTIGTKKYDKLYSGYIKIINKSKLLSWMPEEFGFTATMENDEVKASFVGGFYLIGEIEFQKQIKPLLEAEKLASAPRLKALESLDVRREPRKRSSLVGGVATGDIVILLEKTNVTETIKGKTGTWLKVKMLNTKGTVGYVFDAYVKQIETGPKK